MDEMNNWKQFQGTELGSLMSQIYGNQNKPKISYPKINIKKTNCEEQKTFIPGGANLDAADPRKSTRKVTNISVPKHSMTKSAEESLKPIDIIYRRRSASSIKAEMDDIKMKQAHYRPAYVQPISSEAEKDRLNQIFTYKGGKGLPNELTHAVGEMPLEIERKKKEFERIEAMRIKRGLSSKTIRTELSESEKLAEHISKEIDERRRHLEEMKEMGMLKHEREIILRSEISLKMEELKRIDI